MRDAILCADAREALAGLADASVDAIITDPPYALTSGRDGTKGFMSASWDNGLVAHDATFWAEVLRVAKPGAFLAAFGGTRTYHRLVCAVEDAGWECRDMLNWIYASGFPKSKSCLKPSHEPILLAKAPGQLQPLQIDACRVPTADTLAGRDNHDITGGAYGAGKVGRNGGRYEPTSAGRWPPNLVLSHHPDCQPAGVRRVRGHKHSGKPGNGQDGQVYGKGIVFTGDTACYADADGTEQVQSWECVEPSETLVETFTLPDGSCVDPMAAGFRLLVAALEDVQVRLRHSHSAGMVLSDVGRRDLAALEVPGFQGDCPACRHSYDVHARSVRESARESARQLADALECVLAQGRSPLHSPQCPPAVHLSSSDGSRGESRHCDTHLSKSAAAQSHSSSHEPLSRTPDRACQVPLLSAPRDSTPTSSRERSDAATASMVGRNACSGVGFRSLASVGLRCAAWYLPLQCDTQIVSRAGCPVAELDRQAGPRTSGARQHYIGEQSYGNWRAYEQRSEPRTRPRASAYDASTGSASRFFPCFSAVDDAAVQTPRSRFFPTFAADGALEPEDTVPWMYCPKASRRERNAGCDGLPYERPGVLADDSYVRPADGKGGDTARTIKGNHHPCVKPLTLMQWLVKLVARPGDLILDPFCGSGSTLVACVREGMHFVGVDMSEQYCEIARRRVAYEQEQQAGPLFAGVGGL